MAELRVTSTGTIKLFESDDTSSVTIASPASLGGDRTITLPDVSSTLNVPCLIPCPIYAIFYSVGCVHIV